MERVGSTKNFGTIPPMMIIRGIFAFAAAAALLLNAVPVALACGPGYIEPVFTFDRSPDIPFEEFVSGKIGVIRPTFGRKALVIAYRYLNGGGFNPTEQEELVRALRATPPEEDSEEKAVKAWLEARKEVVPDEKPPAIYTDRPEIGGYNFFPNCTTNAFEVAATTLRDRVGTHGADDRFVHEWLTGQDRVFDICSSGSTYPAAVNPEMPEWLKKDRAYQIAAADFYSMRFEEARRRFEEIAADTDSMWQQTADYLVGRTLVREASLDKDDVSSRISYEQAEERLESVMNRGGKFSNAAEQLLNHVKYRIHPQERFAELSRLLAHVGGNRNVRQDLIDHSWLFDKFEAEAAKAVEEQKRREEEARQGRPPANANTQPSIRQIPEWQRERDSFEKGELIRVTYSYPVPGREYPEYVSINFPFDADDERVIAAFSDRIGRELKAGEREKILEEKKHALEVRKYYLGANYRFGKSREGGYEGGYYSEDDLPSNAYPEFMRADDLSDWIITYQISDEPAFRHALAKYRESKSAAWLIAALAKSNKDSPGVEALIEDGLKAGRSSPAFPTVIYESARLKIELGKHAEAGKLLDELIAGGIRDLPVSAQNRLLGLRIRVAQTLDEFLRFAGRRPVTFNDSGHTYGRLRDFFESEKDYWNEKFYTESREEYVSNLEREYAHLLPWDDRALFDERTVDVINRHFPIDLLAEAAMSRELPEHMRGGMILAVWTRAVLLGRTDLAARFAREAEKAVPGMAETFKAYSSIKSPVAKRNEELWILIKNPKLSAFVSSGLPERGENEVSSWDDGWWHEPSSTYYDRGTEMPKSILRPPFVTARQSAEASTERARIFSRGDAEAYLSERVFRWAAAFPRDPRIPEALYVVATINLPTKYGSGEIEVRERAIKILESRYPRSPWVGKAKDEGY